jgi:hypothetical protein
MNNLILIILTVAIASFAGVQINNGIISNNDEASVLCQTNNSHATVRNLNQTSKQTIKLCTSCRETTHFSIEHPECPNNPANQNMPRCKSCGLFGHTRVTSKHCKRNVNNESERIRVCSDCNGEDHLNKNSNFCPQNPESPFFVNTNGKIIKCKDCDKNGHKTKRSQFCSENVINKARSSISTPTQIIQITKESYFINSDRPLSSIMNTNRKKV